MKVMKKLGIILLNIILAVFILSVAVYKVSEMDTVNGGSAVPRIGTVSFVAVGDKNTINGINEGDLLIALKPDISSLKSGDMVIYKDNGNNIAINRVSSIKGNDFMTDNNGNTGAGIAVPLSSIEGIYSMRLPYFGYIAAFTDTKLGTLICIAVLVIIVLVIAAVIITDIMHNTSRHRKRIIRRRQRRKERYIKEGMYGNKRAMV